VFQKADGKPYRSIKTTWNKCCEKAGVIDAHIHDIRHKGITDMGKKGYTLQEIAKAAGHSQISTTMRYTHLRAEDTREALESLGRKQYWAEKKRDITHLKDWCGCHHLHSGGLILHITGSSSEKAQRQKIWMKRLRYCRRLKNR